MPTRTPHLFSSFLCRPRRAAGTIFGLFLAAASCSTPTDGGARVLSAELTAPAPLVRTLRVELDRPSTLTVEYWTDGDPHLRVESPSAQSANVALTRLRPNRSYHYQVVGTTASGSFASDTVPSDLA